MSNLAMPFIILNMGAEMMYILNQRLQAQTVQDDKARKVLADVARAMFSNIFIDELFKPQETYSSNSTKQVFEKLAHSSIMRLNKSSMDKLCDLMTMGFKYQVLGCSSPSQLLHVTLNHLDNLKTICKSEDASDLIQMVVDRLIDVYAPLTNGQWILLRQELMNFLQGKKIKVSLFLQQQMQSMDGTLLFSNGGRLPYGTEKPFKIRYYSDNKVISQREFDMCSRESFLESDEILDYASPLGGNMYEKDTFSELNRISESSRKCSKFMEAIVPYAAFGAAQSSKKKLRSSQCDAKSSAKAELNMLADLLGMNSSTSSSSKDDSDAKPFKLNLFPDSFDSKGGDEKGGNSIIMIDIDGAADSKSLSYYMEELDLKEDYKADAKGSSIDDEDDLLSLMDSAK
jgi:hypothetical protein